MKRFIRYLYEYRDGQRARNVGFVRVDQDDTSTVVHIHGKGLRLSGERKLRLYIFFRENGVCRGIWQGDIEQINPAVNYRLAFTAEDTGKPEYYPWIDGVILEHEGKRKFAAGWDDMPVDVDGMVEWREQTTEDRVKASPEKDAEAPVREPAEERTEGAPSGESVKEVSEEPKESRQEDMVMEETEVDTYLPPSTPRVEKICRQDIARLPRCEWRLANNSFLLHGCHNYHHLILLDEGDVLWLGVPGIYRRREAKAAESFGFSRFVRLKEELGEDIAGKTMGEEDWGEDFGYWCRKVRRRGDKD